MTQIIDKQACSIDDTCKHERTKWIDGCGWNFKICLDCNTCIEDDFN